MTSGVTSNPGRGLAAFGLVVGGIVLLLFAVVGVRSMMSHVGATLVQVFPPVLEFKENTGKIDMQAFLDRATSDAVLKVAGQDPRAATLAPIWVARHTRDGQFDVERAAVDLASRLRVQHVQDTDLIQIHVYHRDKNEAAGLSTLITDAFIATDANRILVVQQSVHRTTIIR